jgi:DNA-binding transcriptional LysR family regulator
MIEHQIVEARRVICASPEFLKRNGGLKTPADLTNMPCLHYGNLPTGSTWRLTGPEGSKETQVNGVLCSNNAEVLRDAAVKGLGLALLPTFIVGAELQTGRLVTVLNDYKAPRIFLCLLYPPSRHLSARIRLLVEFFYERFGDRPYWDLVY